MTLAKKGLSSTGTVPMFSKHIIMLLTNAFDPDPRVHQEAKSLVEHGYKVTIICWDRDYKKPPFEQIDGINVERIYVRSTHGRGIAQIFFLPLFWLKAFFRIIRRRFDVIHAHDFDTLPLGFLIAKLRRKKIVYDAHESFSDMLYSALPIWATNIIRSAETFLIKRVDLLITVGSILEEEFKKRGAKRTCIVGNWKKLEDFNIAPEIIAKKKEDLGISANKLVISYIAWFSREQKLRELLGAVSMCPDVHLIIGGDGPEKDIVVEAAGKNSNITFLGYVKSKEIPLYTAMADAIVYCFDERNPNARFSAPNKLFEALAAGKTIITGDFGEIGHIVKEEKCGIVLEKFTKDNLKEIFDSFSRNGSLNYCRRNALEAEKTKYNWKEAEQNLLAKYSNIQD